jgi:predicted nucleic acid-binding protein
VKPFLDTNVLLYAIAGDDPRAPVAEALLAEGAVIGVQTLNEFAAVARRKLKMSWEEIEQALAAFQVLCPNPVPIDVETHQGAIKLATQFSLSFYDALMLSAALQAGCSLLYSEDMHDGLKVQQVLTVRNPFTGRNPPT